MDRDRFDEVARSLVRSRASRRTLIAALAASGVARLSGLVWDWDAPADAAKRCKSGRSRHRRKCKRDARKRCQPAEPRSRATCDRDAQCCHGLVCDARACTAGCRIDGAFHAPATANPVNQCQSCQPATSTTAWTSSACGECELCDPETGACAADPAKLFAGCGEPGADGYRPGLCFGSACEAPCGEDCVDYCYLHETSSGDPDPSNPFCCPIAARGPDGACCWINQTAGIFVEGACTAPVQVCADGAACATECCGGSSQGFAGACPTATQFCVDGATMDAGFACTTDHDCATAGYGASSVCAGLSYSCGHDGEPIPDPDSGTCCPSGNTIGPPGIGSCGGPVYGCCSPETRAVGNGRCCGYPAYELDCPSCTCSFRSISRCCR